MLNKFEYKFGTHPFEADAAQVEPYSGSDKLGFAYPDVESRTHVALYAETNSDLTSNMWTTASVIQTNIGQRGNATLKESSVSTAAPRRFLRLRAEEL